MLRVLIFSLGARAIRAMCPCRADLVIENLALRQQVTALKKERPRPLLEDVDRAFWVALRKSCLDGRAGWPSSTPTLSPGGIGHDSDDTGQGYREDTTQIGLELRRDSSPHPHRGAGRLGRTSYPRRADEARVRNPAAIDISSEWTVASPPSSLEVKRSLCRKEQG